jgi:hypothetical protein
VGFWNAPQCNASPPLRSAYEATAGGSTARDQLAGFPGQCHQCPAHRGRILESHNALLTAAGCCTQQLARDSANRNSTTKPGSGGRLLGGDGSNTANGHGSNNANGASTTHVYASNGGGRAGGGADAPLVYRTTDAGSGEGSGGGSGGSRGAGNGSGQGSGSGNEALAAAGRSPPCASPEVLRTQLEAAAVQAAAADAPAACTPGGPASADPPRGARSGSRGNGSNGNSGVGDTGGEAMAAAKRETAEARENAETAAALQVWKLLRCVFCTRTCLWCVMMWQGGKM